MTPLLRRAATCAGLAAIGWSARSQAQIPTKPEPIVGGEIRRPLPAAQPVQQAAPPVVQQSPNGLYGLSITDSGIELLGPSGGVKITNAGIEIGAPNGSRVTISAVGMELWGDKALKLNARESVEIVNGPGANIVKLSPAGMELTGQGLVQVKGVGTVEIVNGTGPGMNAVRLSNTGLEIGNGTGPGMNVVRLSNTGMVLTGGRSVQMNSRETVEIVNGPGANIVKLSAGIELTGKGTVQLKAGGNVELTAGGNADISGGNRVTLGCPGGRPAARAGDAVYANPTTGSGGITAGSNKVLIC